MTDAALHRMAKPPPVVDQPTKDTAAKLAKDTETISVDDAGTKLAKPPSPADSSPIARLRRLVSGRTDNTLVQLFRYTFVGGLAFLVDFGLLALLTEVFGLHSPISAALSFLGGLSTNDAIRTSWVFPERTIDSRRVEFLVFAGDGVIGFGLNERIMWVCTDLPGAHYLLFE